MKQNGARTRDEKYLEIDIKEKSFL